MKIKELTNYLESLFPLSTQESYDNCGLIVGSPDQEISEILVTLDCTEEIVEEAIRKNCNLIVAHHPIVFKGLKSFTGKNYVERTIIRAIENKIAIYAAHTNLDNFQFGVNAEIGKRMGIHSPKILLPKENQLSKLIVYVPEKNATEVANELFASGAGQIGNYSDCSYQSSGMGSFRPLLGANPAIGKLEEVSLVEEKKIEVLVPNHSIQKVVNRMLQVHPYDEVAYDVVPLTNAKANEGAGMYGELEKEMSEHDFLSSIKAAFGCQVIRHTELLKKPIKTVAWCGGAGQFLLSAAKRKKADIFITGDYKYHEFFDAEKEIIIADIGHYESEQYTTNLLADIITKKFPKFALHLTSINTNPIKYF